MRELPIPRLERRNVKGGNGEKHEILDGDAEVRSSPETATAERTAYSQEKLDLFPGATWRNARTHASTHADTLLAPPTCTTHARTRTHHDYHHTCTCDNMHLIPVAHGRQHLWASLQCIHALSYSLSL